MRRLAAYCGRQTGLSEQDWVALAARTLDQVLRDRGVRASDSLLALYRRWLLEGGEVSVTLQPRQSWWGIPVRDENADSGDWALTYNDESVPGLYLTSLPAPPPPVATPAAVARGTPEPAGQPEREGWYAHAPEDVDAWLGYRVRVTLNNGKVVDGRLESADERELAVARPVAGGEVVYPILRRALSQVEIWHRGRHQGGTDPSGGG